MLLFAGLNFDSAVVAWRMGLHTSNVDSPLLQQPYSLAVHEMLLLPECLGTCRGVVSSCCQHKA
jgi:hypothetical protein